MVLRYSPMGHPKFHENYQLVQKLKWRTCSTVTSSAHFLLFLGQWTKNYTYQQLSLHQSLRVPTMWGLSDEVTFYQWAMAHPQVYYILRTWKHQ
jgi:hypothetical protein